MRPAAEALIAASLSTLTASPASPRQPAVILGLTILVVFAVLPLVYTLRFPRTAVAMTALLWLCTALLMLVGVGELESRAATGVGSACPVLCIAAPCSVVLEA